MGLSDLVAETFDNCSGIDLVPEEDKRTWHVKPRPIDPKLPVGESQYMSSAINPGKGKFNLQVTRPKKKKKKKK